jgi:hypothetical protein
MYASSVLRNDIATHAYSRPSYAAERMDQAGSSSPMSADPSLRGALTRNGIHAERIGATTVRTCYKGHDG